MQDIQVDPTLITRVLKREKQSDVIAGFNNKRGPLAKKWGQSLDTGKGKEQIFLLSPQRERSSADTSTLAQWDSCHPEL